MRPIGRAKVALSPAAERYPFYPLSFALIRFNQSEQPKPDALAGSFHQLFRDTPFNGP